MRARLGVKENNHPQNWNFGWATVKTVHRRRTTVFYTLKQPIIRNCVIEEDIIMALVLALALFLIAIIGDKIQTAERQSIVINREIEASGGGRYMPVWDEYVIHCGNYAKVNQQIEDIKKNLTLTEEDEKKRYSGALRLSDDQLLNIKATEILSKKVLGVPWKYREQIAYYYTCVEAIKKGYRPRYRWGTPLSEADSDLKLFRREFAYSPFKCNGWTSRYAPGIGYPLHDKPDESIKNFFSKCATNPADTYIGFDTHEYGENYKKTHFVESRRT